MKNSLQAVIGAVLLFTAIGCGTINRPIHIADGSQVSRSLTSVNGSITIGSSCEIDGTCQTVNGSIKIGDDTSVDGKVASVNGSIRVGQRVIVDGSLKAVNGSVSTGRECRIDGSIATVNGCITLVETIVENKLVTYNGRIILKRGSEVLGDIIIKDTDGNSRRKPLTIKIGGKSIVHGDIINENDDLEVNVYIIEGARVDGELIKCTRIDS